MFYWIDSNLCMIGSESLGRNLATFSSASLKRDCKKIVKRILHVIESRVRVIKASKLTVVTNLRKLTINEIAHV